MIGNRLKPVEALAPSGESFPIVPLSREGCNLRSPICDSNHSLYQQVASDSKANVDMATAIRIAKSNDNHYDNSNNNDNGKSFAGNGKIMQLTHWTIRCLRLCFQSCPPEQGILLLMILIYLDFTNMIKCLLYL